MERILLVEDDSAIYQPLTSFLRGEGFAVRQASGQREALALLETEEFDLVLLDVGLRDGNGFSVCSAVKQRGGTAVIFLSASGDEYSVVTGLDLGADDYIAKPFRPRELVSRIRLKNCSEHMQEGTITVQAEENAVASVVVIRDTGGGIAPQDLPHLFERYYKGENAPEQSVGIGLALSRSIAAAQNGTLTAANVPGGAEFTMKLYKGIV